jgi:hypothetical protein
MAENKTQKTSVSPKEFIKSVEDPQRREDAYELLKIFEEETGDKPVMWGPSIIGYGQYHYKYASGREGDWFLAGFSPRKQNMSLYVMMGFDKYQDLLGKLGKFKTGKGCLYINKLDDVDREVLRELIRKSASIQRH